MPEKVFRDYIDSDYPHLFAVGYDRGPENVEGYLRIGDSAFVVPPSAISVRERTKSHVEDVLRTPGGMVLASGFAQTEVVIGLVFTNTKEIFGLDSLSGVPLDLASRTRVDGGSAGGSYYASPEISAASLAALIAQFKRTPIVPVVNTFLNSVHNIDTLALASIQVSNMLDDEERPVANALVVNLFCYAMEVQAYCPHILNFNNAIIWPLFRWFWRQEFCEFLPGEWRTLVGGVAGTDQDVTIPDGLTTKDIQNIKQLTESQGYLAHTYPHNDGTMSGGFQFSLVSLQWVRILKKLQTEFERLQNFIYSSEFKQLLAQQKQNAVENLQSFQTILSSYKNADAARLTPYHFNDLTLIGISASLTNNFAPQQVSNFKTPTYQHMSQGDVTLVATFWCTSEDALSYFQQMVEDARELIRDSRFELVSGFVGFENEVASLFGCRSVIFTEVQSRNIEGYPGNYILTVEMIGFNRHQRKFEAIQSANNAKALLNGMLSQNMSPISAQGQVMDSIVENGNKFWARYFRDTSLESSSNPQYGANEGFIEQGRPLNAWFNAAYIQQAKEQLRSLELYPDLALPTFDRIIAALDGKEIVDDQNEINAQKLLQGLRQIHWNKNGRFVDPDFYVDYPNTKATISLASINVRNPSSYLSVIASQINQVKYGSPWDFLEVDGSVRNHIAKMAVDTYPDAAVQGPHPMDDIPPIKTPTDGADSSTGQFSKGLGQNIGEQKNRRVTHGKLKFPKSGSLESSILLVPSKAPSVNYSYNHKQINIPSDDELHGVSIEDQVDYIKTDKGLMDHLNYIFGDPNGQGDDKTGLLNQAIMSNHPVDVGNTTESEFHRLIGTFADVLEFDCSGRLLQAYPSFALQLIDEGPRLGWVKLFPNFYAIQAIQSIDILQDRRDPAHVATLEIMNMYGNLSSYSQIQTDLNILSSMTDWSGRIIQSVLGPASVFLNTIDGASSSAAFNQNMSAAIERAKEGILQPIRDLFPSASLFGQSVTDEIADLRRLQRQQMMLRPGVRLHIRMGYGSNAAALPVMFNGRVTEVAYGERMQIIAQGDGIELLKLVPNSEQETTTLNPPSHVTAPFIATGYEPRHIICMMLSSHDVDMFDYSFPTVIVNAWKNFWWKVTDGSVFADNPIGIQHFGNPFLFNFYDFIATPGAGSDANGPVASWDYGTQGAKQSEAFRAIQAYRDQKSHETYLDSVLNHAFNGSAVAAPLPFFSAGIGQLCNILTQTASSSAVTPGAPHWAYKPIGDFVNLVASSAATLFEHSIPSGYGETGENVYPIYSPFQIWTQHLGSQSIQKSAQQLFTGDISGIPNPPNLTPASDSGTLHMPGTSFNMYIHNKSVWDIVEFMSQAFPPYIAAVRPFEYRSTLYFGAPYWQYRYDYDRVTAADLGPQDGKDDKWFGYPYGYKTKPFMQAHYYDTRMNIISNTVRASDEETFTDIVAMWYKGQDNTNNRPEPAPVKQTVDKQIMAALRKTSIINTDYVGADVPPTAGAIIGSLGTAELTYLAKSFGGQDISINGGINYAVMEDNMRHTARALLRDYQKLMYQGRLLIIGDPTVKPYDIMYMDDEYNHMNGMCGVRKVINHLSFDTGYVTSIEPDLLCEVKGENYLTSLWLWLGAYVFANMSYIIAADRAAAYARKAIVRSILGFGLKAENKKGIIAKLFRSLKLPFKGWTIEGKPVEKYTQGFFVGKVREAMLDKINALMSKAAANGKNVPDVDFHAEIKQYLQGAFKNARSLQGESATDQIARDKLATQVDKILADGMDKESDQFFKAIINSLRSSATRNLAAVSGDEVGTIALDTLINRMASEHIVERAAVRFVTQTTGAFDFATVAEKLKIGGQILRVGGKAIGELLEKRAIAAGTGAALEELLLPAIGLSIGGPLGLAIGIAIEIVTGYLFTQVSRWWDDGYSLSIIFLRYRGQELQAGLNGHRPELVVHAVGDDDTEMTLNSQELSALISKGAINAQAGIKTTLDLMSFQDQVTPTDAIPENASGYITKYLPDGRPVTVESGIVGAVFPSKDRVNMLAPYDGTRIHYGGYTNGALNKQDIETQFPFVAPNSLYPGGTVDDLFHIVYQILQAGFNININAVNQTHQTKDGPNGHNGGKAVDIGAIGIASYKNGLMCDPAYDATPAVYMILMLSRTQSALITEIGSSPVVLDYLNNVRPDWRDEITRNIGLPVQLDGDGHVHIQVR